MGSYHARVLSQSPNMELSAVVDFSETKGRALANRHNSQWFPDLPNLSEYGAVIVAAPTESHFEIAQHALNEKVPLLLEKPLTDSIATTRTLINLSKSKDVPMMCGFVERFNPAVLTARQLVQDPIHISTTRHSPYTPRVKTGVAWDLLIHDIDLIIQIFSGQIVSKIVGSSGKFHSDSPSDSNDIAECLLTFESGVISQSSASRLGQRKVRSIVVSERDRLIEVDMLRKGVTVYRHVSDQMMEETSRGYRQQTVIEIPEIVSAREPLVAQLDHFVNLINGKVDADQERKSLLPAHEIIDTITNQF